MKKILLLIIAVLMYVSGISQQISPQPQVTKQDYLQKSKKQFRTGLILLGGGTTLIVAGILTYQKGAASLVLAGLGLLADASSLPFFIASASNKKKANRIAINFNYQKANYLLNSGFANINYPVLSFKVSLK